MMNASVVIFLCSVVGSTLGYYVQREAPYNTGPNDPYLVEASPYNVQEPSQRLFWGNSGSNQVGGTGWWAMLTNKFPFLNNMFGRMELPSQYGLPSQQISTQYGVPNQQVSTQYEVPSRFQPQFYQSVPYNQQQRNQFIPSARNIALTDDAVIITPPQVPIQSPVLPVPVPAPVPVPSPEPAPGYQYNIPQQRLELPTKY